MDHLLQAFKKISRTEEEIGLLEKAFRIAEEAHKGQVRKSGEPYFRHVYFTALRLMEWRLDPPTIIAGFLHDIVEDTAYTLSDVRRDFGDEVVFLVDGVTKLGHIKYRGVKAQAENLRKMILALSQDLRVVMIKLADRLHNMRTLDALPPVKQRRIAMETSEIYSPLAYRLGMQNLAGELEDLAFPYIHPEEYAWLEKNVTEKYEERERYLEKIKPMLAKALADNGILVLNIDFRAKRWSSLWKKLKRYDMNVEQVYDLVAKRIIVRTIEDCYAVLGVIHQLWPPLPGRIKDYIALPKPNGYRSLHTTVFCEDNRPTEFQIRTLEMHDEAENGIAAHWIYAESKTTSGYGEHKTQIAAKRKFAWVSQLRDWQKQFPGSKEFLESLKIDFFRDRIFVITPKGEVIDLPAASTPVDFAYQIHSQVGDQCSGAKVNDRIVTLDHKLQSGDVVEILVQKSKRPSESWINFVKTATAKKRVRASLRAKKRLRNTK
ncbi:bifunctional (p)ppGpp synthetase/guanosine-3',5'-bis(diphosphate) 3'-pyrophosphohydrolase [Candidatus Wolfebacteria bacterium]|nr:bifunctional (p)ppGpp synthetase/guanosine-3',5'-bis(diphosphate) 3'-pyrophosphohydrolase [Candidatus Wolfebacteria bacterium]